MKINSNFDSGNIEVISVEVPENIQLKIRKDEYANFLQWFYFHLTGARDKKCKIHFINASETTYSENGWLGYKAVASYDRKNWFRVPTRYDGKHLIIEHTPQYDGIYYAYFAPYSYERHQNLLATAQLSSNCQVDTLCHTIDNNELSLLTIGQPNANKRKCWIIARQHAGETMAEWFCEGLIHRLLNSNDVLARLLLSKVVFHIVPNMNPDGGIRGNLRANGAGIDLNRQWKTPDKDKAPEVYYVREKMQETGVDFFLDVHGDENIPYVFTVDRSQDPNYNEHIHQLEQTFKASYKLANPDFQDIHGYPSKKHTNDVLLSLASHAIGEAYDCLSFTIEMPFKDNANYPDEKFGWSAERSIQLGNSLLMPLAAVIDQLR